MSRDEHHAVRTTLTLDDDLAERLKREAARSRVSFEETVDQTLRIGLARRKALEAEPPFRIEPRALGLRPGFETPSWSRSRSRTAPPSPPPTATSAASTAWT
jgi:hypothetical protein